MAASLQEKRSVFPVALTACADYTPEKVALAVKSALDAITDAPITHAPSADAPFTDTSGGTWPPSRDSRVLVKPNLLKAHALTCTHPLVVRAVCQWLLDRGVKVTVADSPGFGTAKGVAQSIGLTDALRPLGLSVQSLDCPVKVAVGFDGHENADTTGLSRFFAGPGHWGISRLALESDMILSVPRVKAHAMMGMTLAVKNLFGCVSGLGKVMAHSVQGHQAGLFERCIVDVLQALPPVAACADGITAMHITGPSSGKAFSLGLVAASANAVAMDEALYCLINPALVPVRTEIQRRALPGAFSTDISYCVDSPDAFTAQGFVTPTELQDVSFRPHRLISSTCRRIWKGFSE